MDSKTMQLLYDLAVKLYNKKVSLKDVASEKITEGSAQSITVNRYERSAKARNKCIELYGATCSVCGFDFEKDLIPVCPNCHAMLQKKKPAYSIEELQKNIK